MAFADLLYFPIPSTFSIGWGKHASSSLLAAYSLEQNGQNSFAYLATTSNQSNEEARSDVHVENGSSASSQESAVVKEKPWRPRSLLYGRLYQDGSIEGLLCKSHSPSLLSVISAQSPWKTVMDSSPHVRLMYPHPLLMRLFLIQYYYRSMHNLFTTGPHFVGRSTLIHTIKYLDSALLESLPRTGHVELKSTIPPKKILEDVRFAAICFCCLNRRHPSLCSVFWN